jgi:hypothetical protein
LGLASLFAMTRDPGDNFFFQRTNEGRTDYPVTGNLRYFPRLWKKTKIIGSREFRNLIAPHLLVEVLSSSFAPALVSASDEESSLRM